MSKKVLNLFIFNLVILAASILGYFALSAAIVWIISKERWPINPTYFTLLWGVVLIPSIIFTLKKLEKEHSIKLEKNNWNFRTTKVQTGLIWSLSAVVITMMISSFTTNTTWSNMGSLLNWIFAASIAIPFVFNYELISRFIPDKLASNDNTKYHIAFLSFLVAVLLQLIVPTVNNILFAILGYVTYHIIGVKLFNKEQHLGTNILAGSIFLTSLFVIL